jgi:hypothetical protein
MNKNYRKEYIILSEQTKREIENVLEEATNQEKK